MRTIFKALKSWTSVVLAAALLVALMIGSALMQPTASQAQLNAPYAGTNSSVTIDAARLRGWQGGTNATAGVTTNFVTKAVALNGTNTFTIINGIITAVSTP